MTDAPSAFEAGQRIATVNPFEDAGDVCPHCKRPYDAAPGDRDGESDAGGRLEGIRGTLKFLSAGNDIKAIGWRCVLSEWFVDRTETQAGLASRFGVSEATISKAVKAFRGQIHQWLQGNGAPR